MIVAGASTHPGKFGFVASTTSSPPATEGDVFAHQPRGRRGARRADRRVESTTCPTARPTSCSCAPRRRPTPTCCGPARRRASAPRSSPRPATARRATRAGAAEAELVALADELGHPPRRPERPGRGLDAGDAVRPDRGARTRRPGRIGIASQSGNFVSSFLNYAVQTGVGVSRAVSAGNAAAVGVPDYLEFYADDPATAVGLAYVEGVADGRAFFERMRVGRRARCRSCSSRAAPPPAASGPRPATPARSPPTTASSTACAARPASPGPPRSRRPSRRRPPSPPSRCPTGHRVVVLTTAGGWGVVTADAITRTVARARRRCPTTCGPRSTRSCRPAGAATTRSTWPAARPATRSPRCSSSSPATPTSTRSSTSASASSRTRPRCMRDGPLLPRPRPRADRRLPRAPGRPLRRRPPPRCPTRTGKPVLTATELAVADPANAGPAAVRATGRLCYAVGQPGRHRARPPLAARRGTGSAAASRSDDAGGSSRTPRPDAAQAASLRRPRRLRRRSRSCSAWAAVQEGSGTPTATAAAASRRAPGHAGAVGPPGARRPGRADRRRRACGRSSTRLVAASPEATCLTVSVGGRSIYAHNPDMAARPGVDREARHRRRRARGARAATPRSAPAVVAAAEPRRRRGRRRPGARRRRRPAARDRRRTPRTSATSRRSAPRSRSWPTRSSAAGVRQVDGRLLGDESRYDADRYPDDLARPATREQNQVGPLSRPLGQRRLRRLARPADPRGHRREQPAADPPRTPPGSSRTCCRPAGSTVRGGAGRGHRARRGRRARGRSSPRR